jgi:hypothetical protein
LTRPGGFTLAQLAEAVRLRAGPSNISYTARNAAYDLAKLKGKRLVHRVKGSGCFKANPSGVRAMCAYLILRDKVIKPLLAGVVRPFWPSAQSPSLGRSALRPAPRGAQPNLRTDVPLHAHRPAS